MNHPTATRKTNPTTAPALIPPICPAVRPLSPVAYTVVVAIRVAVSVPETTTDSVEVRDGLNCLTTSVRNSVLMTTPVCDPELNDKVVVLIAEYRVHSPEPHIPPTRQHPPNPVTCKLTRIHLTALMTYLLGLKNRQRSFDHNTQT